MRYALPDDHTALAHKIELCLSPEVKIYCAQSAGVSRFAYNWGQARMLEISKANDEKLSQYTDYLNLHRKILDDIEYREKLIHDEADAKKRPKITKEEIATFKLERYIEDIRYEQDKKRVKILRKLLNLYLPSEQTLRKDFNAIRKEEYPWSYDVSKCAPQQALKDLGTAWTRCFKGVSARPKFHKKFQNDSFYLDNGVIHYTEEEVVIRKNYRGEEVKALRGFLHVPKLKNPIPLKERLRYGNHVKIVSVTISRSADKWYASFQCEVPISELPHTQVVAKNQGTACGIDVGIKDFAIWASMPIGITGELAQHGKQGSVKPYLHIMKRLARLLRMNSTKPRTSEKSLARKGSRRKLRTRDSKKYKRTALEIAKLRKREADIRKDYCEKLSTYIIQNFEIIALEDLNILGMVKNHNLARAILDQGWGMFKRMLIRKAEIYGRKIIMVNRFYPSSKTCSCCGYKNDDLTLSDRSWICPECGTEHDRDLNAAVNILLEALRLYDGMRKENPSWADLSTPYHQKLVKDSLKIFYPEVDLEKFDVFHRSFMQENAERVV